MIHNRPTTAAWRKSSFCNGADACVEITELADGNVLVRDSKSQDGPVLRFTKAEWAAFTAGVREGEFDLPLTGAPVVSAGDGSDGDGATRGAETVLADFGAGPVPA
ncbi:DUF397 domain-containing protein [Nonomuraea sp. B12E4]|uniref:DUF397 domain-containing protein n=1 Tax=Nonomuraea sp. B12E4 TaxID=3153564 RepID=UPI00325C4E09